VFEKARYYADFMRICQIILQVSYFGAGTERAMLAAMKNETKTVSYKCIGRAIKA